MIVIFNTVKKLPLFIVLVGLVSLLTAVSIGSPTYAADMGLPTSVDAKIQNLLLNRAVNYCFKDAGLSGGVLLDAHQRITPDAIDSGDWFASGVGSNLHEAVTGPYLADSRFNLPNSQAEKTNCGTKDMVSLYLKASGNKAIDVLCNSDFVRSDGSSPCSTGNGDLKMKTGLPETAAAFHNKYPEPNLDDAGWYWFYRKTFNWSCGYGKMSSGIVSEKDYEAQKADDKYGYKLLYVTDNKNDTATINGKEVTNAKYVYLIGYKKRADNVQTRNGPYPDFSVINESCKKIQDLIESYGAKYAAATASKSPDELKDDQSSVVTPGGGTGGSESTCGIQGIGWVVCPLMSFLGDVAQNSFNFISDNFLRTRTSTITDPAVVSAWSAIRNIANVAFVIVFLIIIFSQLTGQGVTNYGVKKMLPRLIIAAILMNLSLFICQIAVDISNILGSSLNSLISGLYTGNGIGGGDASGNVGGIVVIVAASILAGATLLLAITGPVLLAVLVAVLMIVLILIARMALIVVLIVVAPLAFVAYLLPNTEQWFKRWWKMFAAILMVYPIIAVVFGASSLASHVISASAGEDMMMQLVAVGVAAIPLFVVPSLLKGSMSAAGSIGAKLSNLSSKANGRIGGKVKDTSKLAQMQKYRAQQAQIRRAQITGGSFKGSNKNPLNWGRNASSRINDAMNQRMGKFGTEQSRLGERINAKIEADEVTAAKASIEKLGLTMDQMTTLAKGGSVTNKEGRTVKADMATQRAAISSVIQTGDHGKTRELVDSIGNSSDTALRAHLADNLAASSKRPGYIGGAALGAIKSGEGVNTAELAAGAIKNNVYSAEKIAIGDDKELAFIEEVARTSASVSDADRVKLRTNAITAQTDDTLSVKIGKNVKQVESISRL